VSNFRRNLPGPLRSARPTNEGPRGGTRDVRRPGDAGFTLVEVLISMLVLTIGLVGIAAMLAITTQMHFGSREAARATRLAQDKFDELMKMDFSSDAEVAVGGDLDADVTAHWDTPAPGVTVRWVVSNGPTDNTREVTVRVLNEHARQYRETELSTIIRQW